MAMELVQAAPDPVLRDAIVRLAGVRHEAPGPVRFRELPCTFVPVILDLDRGWAIGDARRPQEPLERFGPFVAGLTAGPVLVEHPGTAHCLQVDLAPLAARRLLGVPMHELADRTVALEDVLGPPTRELLERIAETEGWPERFALVQRAIARRLRDAPPVSGEVAWALGTITRSRGAAPIGRLAGELGWSHRRLIARFRDQVGLPPKLVARIVRFEAVQGHLAADPAADLARLAAACGFADQAHLAREVGELAGMTPTRLRAESVNSVQDPVAVAA